MTTSVQTLPAGGNTHFSARPLWAAIAVLGVAVLALGASLIHVQTRPLDGHAVFATGDPAALPDEALPAAVVQPAAAPDVVTKSGAVLKSQPMPAPMARAVCASCGQVESVTPLQRQGQAQGTGAVAGGVLGAVVGSQVGKGTGRN